MISILCTSWRTFFIIVEVFDDNEKCPPAGALEVLKPENKAASLYLAGKLLSKKVCK